MNQKAINNIPSLYPKILEKSKEIGFTMPSDLFTGSILKTLVSSKTNSNILELGTGVGLSLCWMLDGLDSESKLISVDNDPNLSEIATGFFGSDSRLEIVCADGTEWINNYNGAKFDLIFADAWPGKYSDLEATLALLNEGGLYIIDDMLPQDNWPENHQQNVDELIERLEKIQNLTLTKLEWSTGIIIATKI